MLKMCYIIWYGIVAVHLVCFILATPLDPVPIGRGFALNEFVKHWEAARYSPHDRGGRREGGGAARRGKRTAPTPGPLELSFKAHNREFHIRLHPDPGSVFADDAEFHGTSGPVEFDMENVFSGTLEDDESSLVHGIITSDGLFDGTIYTKNQVYYIEPLHRYGKSHPQIHSIIYKSSDVIHPSDDGKQPCASHALHQKNLNEHRTNHNLVNQGKFVKYNSDIDSDIDSLQGSSSKRTKRWLPEEELDIFKMADLGYEDEVQEESTSLKNPSLPIDLFIPYYDESNIEPGVHRLRNSTDRTRGILINSYDEDSYNDDSIFSRPNSKNHVEIKTKINIPHDIINKKPVGFTYVSSLLGNVTDSALRHVNKRATIDPKKTTCMLYLQGDHQFYQKFGSEEACIEVMTRHVQRVNSIYKVTDFNQDGKPDNITFMIKRIKVHTAEALKDPLYRFPNNYGVEKFLELFSEEDYDGFCLAYMFTYRDFEMGTLGLAWTGDLKNAGGVCEKNGHYRGSLKSLNTGIVTLLNYGKHVPPAVSHVTLAHEIGHNFGSPHDPDVCTPGGEDGNFIMFARATSGDKKNNNHFSPCSLKSINPVLNNKARSSKGCFTEPQVSLCGNGVVEEGEECDCGWEGDCREPCCHPQRRHPPPGETPCHLTPRSLCSPSQGPCCTAQCSLRFGDQCRSDNGCRDSSHCDGRRPSCPPSASKPNRTLCDDGFICYMGECTGSICVAYGLESCQCSSDRACELCCKLPGAGNPCKSSFQWNQPPYDVPDLYAKPGTPCNDYNGYCDVFQKCREVDPSGPLATLRKLLLSEESLSSFKKWILDYWYAAVLIILAVIGLLVGSTRLLGKKSDGKLKKVTIIHSSTTETVRLPEHCPEGVIIHTAVRSKVPLKKKVALKTRVHRKTKDKSRDSEHQSGANILGKHKKRTQKSLNTGVEESPKHSKGATSSQIEAVAIKLRKAGGINKHKIAIAKRKTKKEVIDYSATQKDRDQGAVSTVPVVVEADSVGKVQNWLLSSPQPAMIKSKSTPVGLTERTYAGGSKTANISKTVKSRHDKINSKSVNNLAVGEKDKVRLQVIYKPPFKFSLKLCKGDKTRVVLDKTTHSRSEHVKKKPHVRLPKAENRLSKNNISPAVGAGPSHDISVSQLSQVSQSSNTATVGLNQVPDSVSYEQASNNDNSNKSIEHRLSQYRKMGPKWTHRKSNSVGQGTPLAESRQNLLLQDQLTNSGEMHFYENLTFASGSADDKINCLDKSSSMPRNISPVYKNKPISRQNSHNVLPSSRNLAPPRVMRMHSENLSTNIKKSFSNASQHNSNKRIHKGNSLNNLHLVARKNSLSDKRRHQTAAEQTYSNIEPVHRLNTAEKRERKLIKGGSPHETALSKGKLRRQMSATELYNSQNRSDFFMPISAGANVADAHRPEFEWFKRNSTDRKVPTSASDMRKGPDPDCLDSHLVPNIPDNQILLERNIEKSSQNLNNYKPVPLHRRQISQEHSPASSYTASFPSSNDQWPVKFGELKNSLPDSNQVTNYQPGTATYQSDMEVLVSDNDYNPYDV